jgi:lysophospholipase L1-like esterase
MDMNNHWKMRCAGAAVSLAIGGAFPAWAQTASLDPWTATWGAPPESLSDVSFNNQTIRQIAHVGPGGSVARIQISNAFGAQPLTVQDVHIAQRTSGSSILASSDHVVTFGGISSVTIPIGAVAFSDAVTFTVQPFSDVAISMFLAGQTAPATGHAFSEQDTYIVAGDVSGAASLSGANVTQQFVFLSNLDVQNAALRGSVVAIGGSLTDGYDPAGISANQNQRWTDDLAKTLSAKGLGVAVINEGIVGSPLLGDFNNGQARFDRDVIAMTGARWVLISDLLLNDLGATPLPTSGDLTAGLAQLVARAHLKGIKAICSTLTPFMGFPSWSAAAEAVRRHLNAIIRSSTSPCDAFFDADIAVRDPDNTSRIKPSFDSGSHIELNAAGNVALANSINTAIFSAAANSGL